MRHRSKFRSNCQIGQTVTKIGRFFDFKDGVHRHLEFFLNFRIFNPRNGQERNFVAIGQTVAEIWRFFQSFGNPPSWVCDAHFGPPTNGIWWPLSLSPRSLYANRSTWENWYMSDRYANRTCGKNFAAGLGGQSEMGAV